MPQDILITPQSTVPEVLKARVRLHAGQLAQVCGDDRMTYQEFGEQVDKLASALQDLGIRPGEKVAIIFPNGNRFPIAMYAVIQAGGVSVGINPTLKANEIKHIIHDSDSVAVMVSDQFSDVDPLSLIRQIKDELPQIRHVIVEGQAQGSEMSLEQLMATTSARSQYHQADPHDLATLIYTSGTTGLPKGSMHSHYTTLYPLIADALEPPTFVQLLKIIRRYGFGYFKKMIQASRNPIKTLMSMPPYTGAGVIGIVSTFLTGRILVHVDRFRPSEYLRVIEKEQVNVIALPPALATILVRHPDIHQYDMSSLIYIALGTAPTPPALVDALIQKFNRPVMIGYGATELVGGVAMTRPFADSPRALRESVGKVVKGWEAKVVNKERQEVPTGEIGELAVRGGMKMLGYYKAEQLTQEVFDQDGWYYTGDLATIDEQGYVRIVGRLKDMIIRAGQNIYPAEVESVLMTHPGIKNAAVIGVPDALSGEKVLAYVIPERNDSLTALEVLNFCRDHMAPYKVPSNVYFVDEFPLNATGKVLKRILREEAVSRN